MSGRSERERLTRALAAARARVTELELDVLRRGRDALTGAVSIESFRTRLGDEIVRAKRHDLAGSLAVLQVDRLDDLHHEHGYEAGDALFRSLVGALRRATRPEDLVARAGDGKLARREPGRAVRPRRTRARRCAGVEDEP